MPRFDRVLGPFAPEAGWVPSPTHILRRATIGDLVGTLPAGRVLEVGCGAGSNLADLARTGHSGRGVDQSERVRAIARQMIADHPSFDVCGEIGRSDVGGYDYLMVFEVLEHIENDTMALADWRRCLKPGGIVVASVPAHRRRWGPSDVWAGHFRRYERNDVERLMSAAGFSTERVVCYGFPVLNLLEPARRISNWFKLRQRAKDPTSPGFNKNKGSQAAATADSGAVRRHEAQLFWLYANPLARLVFRLAFAVQRAFYGSERGTGYVVIGRLSPQRRA